MDKERKRYLKNGALLQEKLICLSDGKYNPFRIYSAKEIEEATHNYDPQLVFCKYGFCSYYRCSLEGRKVTIGALQRTSENADLYLNDIAMSALLSGNQNVLKLLGCCLETSVPSMVYESVENGNLYDRINEFSHMHSQSIPWNIRLKIAREIAYAVAYLHTAFGRPIVHMDVTLRNVFLDERNRAKLANFSEAVSMPEGETLELISGGWFRAYGSSYRKFEVTEKVDVYSFGTFLLEILIRREYFERGNLLMSSDLFHVWKCDEAFDNHFKYFITCHSIDEIVDGTIFNERGGFDQVGQWKAIVELAFRCLEREKDKRPTMVEVTKNLEQIERSTSRISNARIERSLFEEARMLMDKYTIASNICKYPITRRFSLQELKNATNNYNPDNLFHCSRLGMWYHGSFPEQLVSICKISSCNWHENVEHEFKIATEVDAHENILKLLGCCLEAPVPILVYESADKGILLEPPYAEPLPQQMMWSGRLRIASQIAHGIAHLHAAGSIIQGDIKFTNIFLDEHFTVKITNPLCSVPLTVRRYYPNDEDLSEKFDVYCFGLLILQLLSWPNHYRITSHIIEYDGDFGFQRMKGKPSIQYLKYCLRCSSIDDVVDPKTLLAEEANQQNMYQQWQDVVELICNCLEAEKERRPKMTEVAKQLLEIERFSSGGRRRSISDNRTVFSDKFVLTSCNGLQSPFREFSTAKLKEATASYNSLHICNYNNLGVWYRGKLGRQNVLICKLSPVNWEEHIKNEFDISAKLRGRKNVLKLLGCSLESSVPALVYGVQKARYIYRTECLYVALNHCGEVTRKKVFNNSLKIARQVAREVAYLHTSFSSPIVHRNIKSANIFVGKHYTPKLTNFSECTSLHSGETLMAYKLERMKGYVAPEYMNEGIVTEKVDVYGFGVLLIEFLIGQKLLDIFDEIDKEGGFLLDHLKSVFKFPCIDETVNQMVERSGGGIDEQKKWKKLVKLAFKCLEVTKEERPTMKEIVKELNLI